MSSANDDLWRAFWDGKIVDGVPLVLPTGRIVASDPILDPFNKPFTVRVRPGSYSVFLSLVNNDIARIMVQIREGTPIRWVFTKPACFTVDSATGCLMDDKVARFLRRKAEQDQYDKYVRRFRDAITEDDGLWGHYCFDQSSGTNILLFHTFGGDGSFPCYFGYNEEDEIVGLVIDMSPDQSDD